MELCVVSVRRLLMEVDALKSSGTKQVGDKPPAAQTDSEHMLYQLRYRPEEAKFSSTARVGVSKQSFITMMLLLAMFILRNVINLLHGQRQICLQPGLSQCVEMCMVSVKSTFGMYNIFA